MTLVIERTIDPTTWLIVTGWARQTPSVTFSKDDHDQRSLDRPRSATWRLRCCPSDIDSQYVEYHEGDPTATLRILVSVEGDDAQRLERIAEARGNTPHDIVADLSARPIARRRNGTG